MSAKHDAVNDKYKNAQQLMNETALVYHATQMEVRSLREEAKIRYQEAAEAERELQEAAARANATSSAYNETAHQLEEEGQKMMSLLKDFTVANASIKKLATKVGKVSARSNTVAQAVELARVKVAKAEETVEALRNADPSKSEAPEAGAKFLLLAVMTFHIILR
eukprot:2233603-Amphidinium_carterae.1